MQTAAKHRMCIQNKHITNSKTRLQYGWLCSFHVLDNLGEMGILMGHVPIFQNSLEKSVLDSTQHHLKLSGSVTLYSTQMLRSMEKFLIAQFRLQSSSEPIKVTLFSLFNPHGFKYSYSDLTALHAILISGRLTIPGSMLIGAHSMPDSFK